MAGLGRVLQVFLVGRFASTGRLQFHGHLHLWSVHFRLSPKTKVVIVRMAGQDGIDPLNWVEVFHYIEDRVSQSAVESPTLGPCSSATELAQGTFLGGTRK
jgi:hypothetical protein